jgi:hypothetical protein
LDNKYNCSKEAVDNPEIKNVLTRLYSKGKDENVLAIFQKRMRGIGRGIFRGV